MIRVARVRLGGERERGCGLVVRCRLADRLRSTCTAARAARALGGRLAGQVCVRCRRVRADGVGLRDATGVAGAQHANRDVLVSGVTLRRARERAGSLATAGGLSGCLRRVCPVARHGLPGAHEEREHGYGQHHESMFHRFFSFSKHLRSWDGLRPTALVRGRSSAGAVAACAELRRRGEGCVSPHPPRAVDKREGERNEQQREERPTAAVGPAGACPGKA